jgi:hypothetical protein
MIPRGEGGEEWWEGLYGRPRPVPCAYLWGDAITPPAPGDHKGPPFPTSSALAPTDDDELCGSLLGDPCGRPYSQMKVDRILAWWTGAALFAALGRCFAFTTGLRAFVMAATTGFR